MARRLPWIGALTVVCAAALWLRLIGLRYGLPAVYNPDEVAIMSRALAFAKGDLNPHNFLYPTFYFYVLFAWEGLTAIWSVATGAVASFSAFQQEFFLDPTRVFVAGRLLTALLGAATVAATFALGRRVAGPAAGLIAAIFLAISPLHVRDSHYVKHDVPVTLLIVLAYLSYVRLMERDDDDGFARTVALPGALTGLAFATHYYTIFLAIPLAWSVAQRGRDRADAIKRIVAAGLVAGLVFFALSPFVLLEPVTAWRDIRANQQIVVDRAAATLGYAQTAAHYAVLLWRDTVTWPLMLLAIAGLVILAASRPRLTLLLLAFPAPFFLFIAGTFPATRYLIPLVPFLALLASIPVAAIVRRQPAAAVAMACLAAALPLRDSIRAALFIRQADTRTLAQEFVERVVPDGRTILTQAYSAPLTPTADSLHEA
ncbi:MAG TPA: glycosyltransferase family 39 protein, partial [Vicinamibacterales bacterium]